MRLKKLRQVFLRDTNRQDDSLLLQNGHITGRGALLPLGDYELHTVPFIQGAESLSLDGGIMHKDVLTGILSYETIAFRFVEPLHGATSH